MPESRCETLLATEVDRLSSVVPPIHQTASVRLERHGRSARKVAEFLMSEPGVKRVHFPELPDHPQHALFKTYFTGSSGLLSFELRDETAVKTFVNSLGLFRLGVSWGGHESLVYPAAVGHAAAGPTSAVRDFQVPRGLIHLHVGPEHLNDSIEDLEGAFAAVKGGGIKT